MMFASFILTHYFIVLYEDYIVLMQTFVRKKYFCAFFNFFAIGNGFEIIITETLLFGLVE